MNKPYDKPLSGDNQCQCPVCFEYFTTVSGFDKHRYGPYTARKCLTTAELTLKGWNLNTRGFWRRPKPRISLARRRVPAGVNDSGSMGKGRV